MLRESIIVSLRAILALTLLTGAAYPLLITGVSQLAFPGQSHGSLIMKQSQALGSDLIAQPFSDPSHFWSRPSGTSPKPYDGAASSGTNLGPTNPALKDALADRIKALREADPGNLKPVPVDLVTASGSGLDPHISPAAAEYQLDRVARARKLSSEVVAQAVTRYTQGRTFGVLGEPRVNVLRLNLALDGRIQ